MLKATAYTATPIAPASPSAAAPTAAVDQPIALTRGELFRILEEDGDQSVVDFNANVPVIASKFASSPAPRGKFLLPANRMVPFRIANYIVPREQMEQWRQGKAAYSKIFAVSFANLRVPALAKIRFGCGDTVTLTRKDASNRDIKAGFEVSVGGSFWTWVKAGLNSSGSLSDQYSEIKETAFKQTSIRRGVLSPIEYRGAGGQDELFWAGVIETCHSVPNWRTIGVRYGDDEHYLHNEMYQLDDTGKEPAATALQDPTQPKLEKVTPGGNPFDRIKGVYAPRCFLQAQNFEQQALQVMAAEPVHRVRASAAMVTSPQMGSADLTRFYSDTGCAAP